MKFASLGVLLVLLFTGLSGSANAWPAKKGTYFNVEVALWFGDSPANEQGPYRCGEMNRCASNPAEAANIVKAQCIADQRKMGWRWVRAEVVSSQPTGGVCHYMP